MASDNQAGKGDKWRKTNFKAYRDNFPSDMGPKKVRPFPNPRAGQHRLEDGKLIPCCDNEDRDMNGGCKNCGSPSL